MDQTVLLEDRVSLAHFRRVVSWTDLPVTLKNNANARCHADCHLHVNGRPEEMAERGLIRATAMQWDVRPATPSCSQDSLPQDELFLLLCPVSALPLAEMEFTLSPFTAQGEFSASSTTFHLFAVTVPLNAPSSTKQAVQWSRQFWPSVYRAYNAHGPQPATLLKEEERLLHGNAIRSWVSLAVKLSRDPFSSGASAGTFGAEVGAVVVEFEADQGRPVVGARDARWAPRGSAVTRLSSDKSFLGSGCETPNPLAHAVMRAIALVARKRVEIKQGTRMMGVRADAVPVAESDASDVPSLMGVPASKGSLITRTGFLDGPMTDMEMSLYSESPLKPGGYLCTGMILIVSHEPCVSCVMAAIHSRFHAVIFVKRMRWGALRAEAQEPLDFGEDDCNGPEALSTAAKCTTEAAVKSPGYGLFWRRELNWRMFAWHWDDGQNDEQGVQNLLA